MGRYTDPRKAKAVLSCVRNSEDRAYYLILYTSGHTPVAFTVITPHFLFQPSPDNFVQLRDVVNHHWAVRFRTKEELEEFGKHVLVVKMSANTSPIKAVQSCDLSQGEGTSPSHSNALVADHGDQATVLLTCWLVDSNTIADVPHWASVVQSRRASGEEEEELGLVTINIKKRIEIPPLGLGEGLLGMRINGTRFLILQTSQRQGKSGRSSLESMLGLPPHHVCLFKVNLLKLKKRGAEEKENPREKLQKTKDKKRIQELTSSLSELEAKLRISQDTVDKMFGRRLEGSTIHELVSLEEILLASYKLVIAQKVRLEHKEEEKKKSECVLCLDKPRSCVLVPCGHACCCIGCAKKLNNCPLCRREIADKLPLYL